MRSLRSGLLISATLALAAAGCSPGAEEGNADSGTVDGSGGTSGSGGAIGGSGGKPGTGGSGAGGDTGSGGTPGSGGKGSGGAVGSGGNGSGGAVGSGGKVCDLPTTFKWSSTGPLAQPQTLAGHEFVSLKDFTITKYNGKYVVYATAYDDAWRSVELSFTDFPQMATATQTFITSRSAVAPTLFYFTPKKQWVLAYQWGFQYATSSDPSNPSSWTAGKSLLSGNPVSGGSGPIDQTVICDATNCYLFFAGDNGQIYRASMPLSSFPGTFTNAVSIMSDTQAKLFEAVQVYSVTGTGKYLMIVEAMGAGGRYFRAFTSTSLGGSFTAMPSASTEAQPFAGKANVTFANGTAWTNDISHGDMVRDDPAETQPIDACNMRFLYQGRDPKVNVDYGLLPYRPGLLTRTN